MTSPLSAAIFVCFLDCFCWLDACLFVRCFYTLLFSLFFYRVFCLAVVVSQVVRSKITLFRINASPSFPLFFLLSFSSSLLLDRFIRSLSVIPSFYFGFFLLLIERSGKVGKQ